jgi:hypothetical protein
MTERRLDTNDLKLRQAMTKRVGACLRHWEKNRGAIRSMRGPRQVYLWESVR